MSLGGKSVSSANKQNRHQIGRQISMNSTQEKISSDVNKTDAELVQKGDEVLSTLDELSALREEITECSKFKNVWQLTEVGLTLRSIDFVLQYDEHGDMIQILVREPKTEALRPAREDEELSLTIAMGKLCTAG